MDDIDRQLISLLRQDARLSVATLANKLGVSRGTVTNRLRKLEDEQVIVGYTLRLKPEAEPDQIRRRIARQGPVGQKEQRRADHRDGSAGHGGSETRQRAGERHDADEQGRRRGNMDIAIEQDRQQRNCRCQRRTGDRTPSEPHGPVSLLPNEVRPQHWPIVAPMRCDFMRCA